MTAARTSSAGGSLLELVLIVAVALGLALGIQAFLVKPFRIPSPSMVPTLEVGQRVLVNRVGTHFGDPDRGDVIVFKPPAGANTHECGDPAKRNDQPCGKPIDEPYVAKDTSCDNLCNLEEPITIPPGHFFMMGDNRGESDDSRDWGPVPKKWIIGDAFFTYWPPSRIGTL